MKNRQQLEAQTKDMVKFIANRIQDAERAKAITVKTEILLKKHDLVSQAMAQEKELAIKTKNTVSNTQILGLKTKSLRSLTR